MTDKKTRINQFDFGENWNEFSINALDQEKVKAAKLEFDDLLKGIDLDGMSFLEIGFGQGLSLIFAAQAGARVVGCDINPKCAEALTATNNVVQYSGITGIELVIGSILEEVTVEKLKRNIEASGGYDIVHSWGVLHHTGEMWKAIKNSASLVKPGGYFAIAIYNRHWSSAPWWLIKRIYVSAPRFVQKVLIGLFSPIIWLAKLLVTRQRPGKMARGMDFHYNVIDWVGGYPYEYASIEEIVKPLQQMGFNLVHSTEAEVPTGCNEFLFRKVRR